MVKDVLHQGILTGILPGGTRLVQSRIAAELAVSTRPVHDALRDLAAEGFVRFDADGCGVVHEVNRTELVDIYEIRAMLEPLAAARAAKHARRADMLEAAGLLTAMERETDMSQWAEYNCEFHNVIERAGNSPRLLALLKNLRELSAIYVAHSLLSEPERIQYGNAEHAKILQAIVARDPGAAAEAMLQHLGGTLQVLLNVHQIGDRHRRRRSTG
jgi:DNA-binding GntR family transcriptional regulator